MIWLSAGDSLIGNRNPCVRVVLLCTHNFEWFTVFCLEVIIIMYYLEVWWNILLKSISSLYYPKWWQRIPLLGNGVGGWDDPAHH